MPPDVAAELKARYPAIRACRVAFHGEQAHLEVLLPEHQIIVNASGDTPERALAQLRTRALAQLGALARRDRAIAPAPQEAAA